MAKKQITTRVKINNLVKDLEAHNPVGLAIMFERLLTSAAELKRHVADFPKLYERHIIHPDMMVDYADRVAANLNPEGFKPGAKL